jgi:hypothetical protein
MRQLRSLSMREPLTANPRPLTSVTSEVEAYR